MEGGLKDRLRSSRLSTSEAATRGRKAIGGRTRVLAAEKLKATNPAPYFKASALAKKLSRSKSGNREENSGMEVEMEREVAVTEGEASNKGKQKEVVEETEEKRTTVVKSQETGIILAGDIRDVEEEEGEVKKRETKRQQEAKESNLAFTLKKRFKCRLTWDLMEGINSEEKLENTVFAFSEYPHFLGAKVIT